MDHNSDWTKSIDLSKFNLQAFTKRLDDAVSGKPITWKCPFCGNDVVLIEQDSVHSVIGCTVCDMRIKLGEF